MRLPTNLSMLALLLSVSACSAGPDLQKAQDQVTWFHRVYNGADFAAIVDQADPGFTATATRAQAIGFLAHVQGKLGKETISQQTG